MVQSQERSRVFSDQVWLRPNATKAQPRSRIRTDCLSLFYLYHHHLPVPLLPMIARSQTPAINICARFMESDSCIYCAHWSPDVLRNSALTLTALTLALSLVSVARLPYPWRAWLTYPIPSDLGSPLIRFPALLDWSPPPSWPTPSDSLFRVQSLSPLRKSFFVLITLHR